jgi:hypothetical protein
MELFEPIGRNLFWKPERADLCRNLSDKNSDYLRVMRKRKELVG